MSARADAKHYALAWAALVALALASLGVSFLHLGAWALFAAFAVASLKGLIVIVAFMHLFRASSSVRVGVLVSVALFAALAALMAGDVATRSRAPLLPPDPSAAGGAR